MLRDRPALVGTLVAVPVAVVIAWFVHVSLFLPANPAYIAEREVLAIGLAYGSLRGAAFGVAFILAGALVAPKVLRQEAGVLGAFGRFVAIGLIVGTVLAVLDAAAPDHLGLALIGSFPFKLLFSTLATFVIWAPGGFIWSMITTRILLPAESDEASDGAVGAVASFVKDPRTGLRINRG